MKHEVKRVVAAVMLILASVASVQVGLIGPAQSAAPWVRPMDSGRLTGGFAPPGHNGVDIIVEKWTPIKAVTQGTVEQVVCNAWVRSSGASYSCNVDGGPSIGGCGWYVGIRHWDGTGSLYCHMVQAPSVRQGQSVSPGQVIGYVGSSGGSGTPHLHFQTHTGRSTTDSNTVDPINFMLGRGVDIRGGGGGGGNPQPPATYQVDIFAAAPGSSTPGGARTGTLNAGLNYVYCKAWGPEVRVGSSYNRWWLKTDLDSGSPWQNQWVSAYYLSRWGNDQAKDNGGNDIPYCKWYVDTFAAAPGRSSPNVATTTGTLNAGTNYVYCKVSGPEVRVGSSYNHWWMRTDLDSGNPWANQYVSAYYLSRWGNDEVKDNTGFEIPWC